MTDTTVEILQARGEPARYERLLGEILVGLDRAGQLRRLVATRGGPDDGADDRRARGPDRGLAERDGRSEPEPGSPRSATGPAAGPPPGGPSADADARAAAVRRPAGEPRTPVPRLEPAPRLGREAAAVAGDQVERLLAIIRDELGRPSHRRLHEIEPGRWWLTDPADIAAAALPLADRVEWAVFSLLSTAGRLSESAFNERIAALFTGHDLPDEALVAACLDSYRSLASTPDRIVTSDDLLRRSHEHSEIVADLVDIGHRLGMRAWIASREQVRRVRGRHLAEWLDDSERRQGPPRVGRARPDDVDEIDVVWQVRGRASFLFEVEWTAMLGEPLLRRARSSRRPTTPSGSSWSSPSGRSSSATSSSGRRSCGPRWRPATGTSSRRTTCAPSPPTRWSRSATSSRTSASIRRSSTAAASRCRCSRADPRDPCTLSAVRSAAVPRPARSRATGGSSVTKLDPTSPVNVLADRFWEAILAEDPTTATMYGDERYDDRLDDPSPAGRARRRRLMETTLAEADAIDPAGQPLEDRITLDMIRVVCDLGLVQDDQRTDLLRVVDQMAGPQTLLPQLVMFQPADTPERLERFEARLRAYAGYMAANRELLREGIASG